MLRRLPVYVLLDCSESMIGPGIEGLRVAVDAMLRELRRNPQALETVWMSFITFAGTARQVVPLAALEEIQLPTLSIAPGTALGAALGLAARSIRSDVRKSTAAQKGDFRPLVFIITDGEATDNWNSGASDLTATKASVYAIGCGQDVDFHQLGKITENVLRVDQVDAESMARLLRWVSGSVQTASRGVAEVAGDSLTEKLPADLEKVDLSKMPKRGGRARHVFIQMMCQQQRAPYLVRYALRGDGRAYEATASHRLEGETFEGSSDFALPAVAANLLQGTAACPYCEATGWWQCGCGALACVRMPWAGSVTCPKCGKSGQLTEGNFEVQQRAG